MTYIIPGHMTEEASHAIGVAMTVLAVAVLTLAVFAVWGVVLLVRSWQRRHGPGRGSDRPEE